MIYLCSSNKLLKLLLPLQFRLDTNLFLGGVKLMGYFASPVNVLPSNFCVVPSPRTDNIYFYYQDAYMS